MKTIELTQGYKAIVDDSDYAYLSQFKWHYNCGYAERKENGKHIRMHRELCKGKIIDHINGITLDNRRENLRPATKSQNAMNMRKIGYKGVSRDKNSYRVQIMKNGKRVFSESAPNERAAAYIYDLNAATLFGQYASLNFPSALRG
jgi:HNH endonuclease